MKKLISMLAMAISLTACAQTTKEQKKLVFVTKNNVNIRATPSTQGKIVGKGREGMVFMAANDNSGWTQVTDALGKNAYISTSMLDGITQEELKVYKVTDILITPEEEKSGDVSTGYISTTTTSGGACETSWTFIGSKVEPKGKVKAVCDIMLTYNDGRARGNQIYYTGEMHGWYLLLTAQTDDEGNGAEKLEKPIVVYPAFSSNRGIFVDGEYIADTNDSDNWE